MLKKLLFAYLFINSIVSSSQEMVNSTSIELKKNVQIFQIVDDSIKQTTLFMADESRIKAIRLDDKMKFIDSTSSQKPEKTYSGMIGNIVSGNKTTLFWASSNKKKILAQIFDSENNKTLEKAHALEFKNEVYLQEFSIGSKFIILTLPKKSNIFRLYVFDNQGNLEIKDFDLTKNKFYHRSTLYEIFEEGLLPFERPFSLVQINSDSPSSLINTAKKRKCYAQNNKIIITVDTDISYTQVISLDLKTFTATLQNILNTSHSKFSQDDYDIKSNSFINSNKLYQIKSSSDKIFLTIKDMNGTLIKEYSATDETTIDFKNSEINLKGGDFGGKRVLETSSQFLRKVNNLNPGISCYQVGENTLMTLGGVSQEQQSASQALLGGFGFIGAALYYTVVYSPIIDNFNSYERRKVVKIEGLFDKNSNHVAGDLQPLAFDKINTFLENNKDIKAQTMFKLDNYYYFGYYDKDAKEYIIRKFAD